MASGPITSWQIDGETVQTVTDFILGGSKITADGECNHEIKRCLLLGRKVLTNLDSILKSRDITLIQPVHPKGNQSWIFIGWADAEAETPMLWPPDAKNWLTRKDSDAGKDWRWGEKGWQRMSWLDGITDSMDMRDGRWWRTGKPGVLHGVTESQIGLSEWTTTMFVIAFLPRSKYLLISWLKSPSSLFGSPRK